MFQLRTFKGAVADLLQSDVAAWRSPYCVAVIYFLLRAALERSSEQLL